MSQRNIATGNMPDSYLKILSKDKLFKKLLKEPVTYKPKKNANLPLFLYISIINQQLSTRVGQVIFKRFLDIFDGKEPASELVAATDIDIFRGIGLSNSKASYIKNVARFDMEQGLTRKIFNKMDDEEAIAYLTSIKGIGKWTAHIFLMSALGREDVFPADDLIVQKAMASLYSLDRDDKKKFREEIHRIADQWKPYRTYASLHLWRWSSNPVIDEPQA